MADGSHNEASQGTDAKARKACDLDHAVLRRLSNIELYLGLNPNDQNVLNVERTAVSEDGDYKNDQDSSLWQAVNVLRKITPPGITSRIWSSSLISQIWRLFHESMPELHFLSAKHIFTDPSPLLLAAMLYFSTSRGTSEIAKFSSDYLSVLCSAIAQLSLPGSEIGDSQTDPAATEKWAFQTVLGIILAGLLTEATKKETGIWISIAYRLVLEHCPAQIDDRSREWRKLFTGLQIVDLEHASLHMSCPVIPIQAPLTRLQTSAVDQLYRLSCMMHTGLTHFTGRGLPTIWSCFSRPPEDTPVPVVTFSGADSAVIRDWARQLDDWLEKFGSGAFESEQDRKLVYRQYILHRLCVLSIYHPARGCRLFSNSTTPHEQHELLLSARAAIKLHREDVTIWSNWDLVMITWAALIVLQGVEGGVGEPDDLNMIRVHLNMLRQTSEPEPSLRHTLAARLEQSLEGMHTPVVANAELLDQAIAQNIGYPWTIFDEASLQAAAAYQFWPMQQQMV
ncbi:hypothetical protein MBLNU459_g4827t1 [Dothideomycetes sp. NU459]